MSVSEELLNAVEAWKVEDEKFAGKQRSRHPCS